MTAAQKTRSEMIDEAVINVLAKHPNAVTKHYHPEVEGAYLVDVLFPNWVCAEYRRIVEQKK